MKYLKTIQRGLASLLIIGILSTGISASANNVIEVSYVDQNITNATKTKTGSYCSVTAYPYKTTTSKENQRKKYAVYHDYTKNSDGGYTLRINKMNSGTKQVIEAEVASNTKIKKRISTGWIYNKDTSEIQETVKITLTD